MSFTAFQPILGKPILADDEKKTIVYRMYREYKREFPDVADISSKEAMNLMVTDKVVFVDTRKEAEMAVSMLPQSVSRQEFLKDPGKYKDYKVIGYCTISYRSGLVAEEMAEKGLLMHNLEGGILAWVLEGGKVYDNNGETARIHVYGDKWNYPPKGYEAVMFGFFEQIF